MHRGNDGGLPTAINPKVGSCGTSTVAAVKAESRRTWILSPSTSPGDDTSEKVTTNPTGPESQDLIGQNKRNPLVLPPWGYDGARHV